MRFSPPIRAARKSVSGLPRDFWWLWTGTLINRLGTFVATFLAIYLTVERGYSASYAGLVAALYGLGGVGSTLASGVLADRLGRRPTLMLAQSTAALSVALLGFMTRPAAIAAVAFLVGAATYATPPALQAMMADIVRPEDRMRAFSLNYWAINLGVAISSVAAGFVAQYSYLAGFLGEATLTLACAVLVFFKVPESRPSVSQKVTPEAVAAVSLGTVLRDRRFMSVVGLALAIALVFKMSTVALPITMGHEGFSSSDYGTAIAANGVLIVLLQIPVSHFIQHRGTTSLLAVSSLLAGWGFGLTAFAGSVGAYAFTVGVWTLGEIINSPTQASLVVRLSPLHGRGRYQGVFSLCWTISALTAPLIAGVVLDRWGSDWLWAGCAILGTLVAVGYGMLSRWLPEPDTEVGGRKATALAPSTQATKTT
ncbi:MDR family MFS transporter [Streptomyces sp. NPDC048192]|uniref:MDR family MFS transporter n=1 Tax=Streptomyces sp. NPDC048192 TaxID=3365510 RepID=UPI0037176A8A